MIIKKVFTLDCCITPIKSQAVPDEWWKNVGLCWAFSSVASFDSSLLKQGFVTNPLEV